MAELIGTVNRLFVNNKSKDGKEYITKKGDPYTIVNIQIDDNEYCSNLYFADQKPEFKRGDKIKVELSENGNFRNFKFLEIITPKEENPDYKEPEKQESKKTETKQVETKQATPEQVASPEDMAPDFDEEMEVTQPETNIDSNEELRPEDLPF